MHSGTDPRLVLIHPPAISKRYLRTKFLPYGMSVIYAFLKEHHVPVFQYDFLMEYLFASDGDIDFHNPERSFSEQEFFSFLEGASRHAGLAAFVEKYGGRVLPDAGIYAFSIVAYHQFWSSLLLARHIRKINPHAVIVFGGPFITIKPPEFFLRYGIADYWIKGSGELPLLMLHRILQGTKDISIDEVPGIIHLNSPNPLGTAKSSLPAEQEPPPDFEGLALDTYRYDHHLIGSKTLFLPYRTSKGCPSRCSFCTGRLVDRYDCKSADKVVSELSALAQKYRTNAFQFADASVNGNPRLLSTICDRLVESLPNIRWYAYSRVNGFSTELLNKAKKAGCFALFWGVESAHQPTVELLGKNFKAEKMYDLLDQASELEIKNYVHIMFNTPHESTEVIESFARLVDRYIDSDYVTFLPQRFLLEPQSSMFERPDKYGLKNIHRVETSQFEREQFIYGEVGGPDHHGVEERNARHRKSLANYLERIHYRNMLQASSSSLVRRLPSGWISYIERHSVSSRFMRWIHLILMRIIRSTTPELREQL
ncbi:MAG TPA: radical SAM protein [Desulfomonilaceae bacterium]|nr:radical SAM protein [Desulfomonilaceae bacterium]